MTTARLFTPLRLREIELRNRVVISPMFQGAADANGQASDWHLVHLGQLAIGRPGTVFTEVCAIEPRGRVTYADLGIWEDAHVEGLKRLSGFINGQNVIPGLQIGHAGRKASSRRPWDGAMQGLDGSDAARGEPPWETVAPSQETFEESRSTPRELTRGKIAQLVEKFAAAARRGVQANFRALEIHAAHGYLIHQFLSASSNHRSDQYGGALANRMRFALDVIEAVRGVWPKNLPLFLRISVGDGTDPGWTMEETLAFALEARAKGVDVIDCSSGGIGLANMNIRGRSIPGFQVDLAAKVRAATGANVMAVGLIRSPHYAEEIIANDKADLIAVGREALFNPRWPLHAAQTLGADDQYNNWPIRYGWWLAHRAQTQKNEVTNSNYRHTHT